MFYFVWQCDKQKIAYCYYERRREDIIGDNKQALIQKKYEKFTEVRGKLETQA